MRFFKPARALFAIAVLLASTASGLAAAALKSARGGEVRALLVGIDKYAFVNPLRGAVADIRDIEASLKSAGVPATNIRVLADLDATRAAFVAGMEKLLGDSKSGDLVVISFSGHGMRVPELAQWKGHDPGGMSEEFVLANFQLTGIGTREGVMNKEMKAWLARMDAKGIDVIFVADTCHGGGLARSVSPEAPDLTIRLLKDAPKEADNQFTPINVTGRELTVDIQDLPHISFLAGADRSHVVPEVLIKGQATPRGALSYAFARAIEGKAAGDDKAVTSRAQLFGYALQMVSQYSKEQQIIDFLPQPSDPLAFAAPLMRMVGDSAPPPPVSPVALASPAGAADIIRVFAVNGDASALKEVKAVAQFAATASKSEADLIWDVAARKIISATGDIVAEDVGPAQMAGVIDRTFAINRIDKLSQLHPQAIRLQAGGKRYTPKDVPVILAPGLQGQHLLVFNIAGNGALQMLSPLKNAPDSIAEPQWSFTPTVNPPYGEDRVVAIAGPAAMPELAAWLWSHDQKPAAGLLPDRLSTLIAANPAVRIGTVGLFTSP